MNKTYTIDSATVKLIENWLAIDDEETGKANKGLQDIADTLSKSLVRDLSIKDEGMRAHAATYDIEAVQEKVKQLNEDIEYNRGRTFILKPILSGIHEVEAPQMGYEEALKMVVDTYAQMERYDRLAGDDEVVKGWAEEEREKYWTQASTIAAIFGKKRSEVIEDVVRKHFQNRREVE